MARLRPHAKLRDLDPEVRALVAELVTTRRSRKLRAARRIREFLEDTDPDGRERRHQIIDALLRLVSHRRELCPRLERELCRYVAEHDLPIEFRERIAQLGLTGHRRPFQHATLGMLRRQDDGAWNTLYGLLREKALRAARRLKPGDPQLVDEIAHDASVKFYEHVQRRDRDLEDYVRGFAPLVATITRHLYLDNHEQARRTRPLPDDDMSEALLRRGVKEDLDRADVLVEQLGIGEFVDMIHAEASDPQWLEIANLVVRGLNLNRIAAALNTNPSTLKSKWARGRAVVRERLVALGRDPR